MADPDAHRVRRERRDHPVGAAVTVVGSAGTATPPPAAGAAAGHRVHRPAGPRPATRADGVAVHETTSDSGLVESRGVRAEIAGATTELVVELVVKVVVELVGGVVKVVVDVVALVVEVVAAGVAGRAVVMIAAGRRRARCPSCPSCPAWSLRVRPRPRSVMNGSVSLSMVAEWRVRPRTTPSAARAAGVEVVGVAGGDEHGGGVRGVEHGDRDVDGGQQGGRVVQAAQQPLLARTHPGCAAASGSVARGDGGRVRRPGSGSMRFAQDEQHLAGQQLVVAVLLGEPGEVGEVARVRRRPARDAEDAGPGCAAAAGGCAGRPAGRGSGSGRGRRGRAGSGRTRRPARPARPGSATRS